MINLAESASSRLCTNVYPCISELSKGALNGTDSSDQFNQSALKSINRMIRVKSGTQGQPRDNSQRAKSEFVTSKRTSDNSGVAGRILLSPTDRKNLTNCQH